MKPILSFGRTGTTQRGFTLVELMVAMTIGIFLSAGVSSLFLGVRQSYRASDGMARLQENGRFVIDQLSGYLRLTGLKEEDFEWPGTVIEGWQGSSTDPSSEGLTSYTPNTDVLRITYRDLTHSETRQRIYYIGPDPSAPSGAIPNLRERVDTSPAQGLIEGVYNMQLRYGIDNNGDHQIDAYANAAAVTDWDQVIAVRIDLLLGSTENGLVDAPMSLPFELNDGTFFTAPDRRLYLIFSTTIALRNRLL